MARDSATRGRRVRRRFGYLVWFPAHREPTDEDRRTTDLKGETVASPIRMEPATKQWDVCSRSRDEGGKPFERDLSPLDLFADDWKTSNEQASDKLRACKPSFKGENRPKGTWVEGNALVLPCESDWLRLTMGAFQILRSNSKEGPGDVKSATGKSLFGVGPSDPGLSTRGGKYGPCTRAVFGFRQGRRGKPRMDSTWVRQAIHHYDGDLEARMTHWAGRKLPPHALGRSFEEQSAETRAAYSRAYSDAPFVTCETGCVLEQMTEETSRQDVPRDLDRANYRSGFDLRYNRTAGWAGAFTIDVCVRAAFRCVSDEGDDPPQQGETTKRPVVGPPSPLWLHTAMSTEYRSYDDYVRAVRMCVENRAVYGDTPYFRKSDAYPQVARHRERGRSSLRRTTMGPAARGQRPQPILGVPRRVLDTAAAAIEHAAMAQRPTDRFWARASAYTALRGLELEYEAQSGQAPFLNQVRLESEGRYL